MKEFDRWVQKNNLEVLEEVKEVNFQVGQIVTYINDYGVEFKGLKILGFERPTSKDPLNENCVYLEMESYWYPVKPNSLKLESND